jgi:TonB family protein
MKYGTIVAVLIILTWGCTHIESSRDPNYAPPTVKTQPRLMYPKVAQENSYSGKTKLVIYVDDQGIVDRVVMLNSSGHKILDDAALNYCKQLTFKPAELNSEPVKSRVEWEVKFNISQQNLDPLVYLQNIQSLYNKLSSASNIERKDILNQILSEHKEFVQSMGDVVNFNTVIGKVISADLASQWKSDWNSWPVSFLLYHDFMKRYPDFDSMAVVKELFIKSLKFDLAYIINTPSAQLSKKWEKDKILNRIKAFVTINYPEININELPTSNLISTKSAI